MTLYEIQRSSNNAKKNQYDSKNIEKIMQI